MTFQTPSEAMTFFDHLETAKGPSLGTNFTLWQEISSLAFYLKLTVVSSPYTLLAHYGELDWVSFQLEVVFGFQALNLAGCSVRR